MVKENNKLFENNFYDGVFFKPNRGEWCFLGMCSTRTAMMLTKRNICEHFNRPHSSAIFDSYAGEELEKIR